MSQKKYELTSETITYRGRTLHRIRALVAIASIGVSTGDFGGYVEAENNLAQSGDAWVFGDAWVYGNARVSGDAWVFGDAWVSGDARVSGNARVYGNALVYGHADVFGDARVYGHARVFGDADVFGDAWVSGDARVYGNAEVFGDARVYGNAEVYGDARVYGHAWVFGDAEVFGDANLFEELHYFSVSPVGSEGGILTIFRTKSGVFVKRGCFSGTLDEFEEAVQETHGDNRHGSEYRLLIELARLRAAEWHKGDE